jgi:Mu-like prophage I protein
MALPDRIPYIWPTELRLSAAEAASDTPRKWIQVAKTGEFFSSRYGKFEISRTDLATMLSNFRTITPQAPTQLPLDYDHLGMDPKNPGDGKAAGWFSGQMELRADGNELWAEVEFTPKAAEHVRDKEYRYISPSFVKNYVWKNGKNIGTTLLAAAITNMPFLEGMAAITLSNNLGELAVPMTLSGEPTEAGQMVMIKPEVNKPLAEKSFEIVEVAGNGADTFVQLKNTDGTVLAGWYRVSTDLAPAKLTTNPADPSTTPAAADPKAAAKAAKTGDKPVDPAKAAIATKAKPKNLSEDTTMPEVFKLRNATGADVEVASDDVQKFIDEQVAAAAKAAADEKAKALVPEGSVVISASKLGELDASAKEVVNLRSEVTNLTEQNRQAAQREHVGYVTKQVDVLSLSAKITKPERDHLIETYSDPSTREAFDKYFPILNGRPAVVSLSTRGSGGDATDTSETGDADKQIAQLATAMAKEEKISYGEALRRVSTQRTDLSNKFLDNTRIDGRQRVQ